MQDFTTEERQALLQDLFDNMSLMKRAMQGKMQSVHRLLPIPASQLLLLTTIRHNQPISFKDLSKQLYLTPGAISQLAETLESQQYISRRADKHDRRIQCLYMTRRGEKLLQEIEKKQRSFLTSALEDLTDEELEIWVRGQHKILQKFHTTFTQKEEEQA